MCYGGTDSSLIELLPRERPSERCSEPKPKLRRTVEFNPQVAPHASDSEWCGAGQNIINYKRFEVHPGGTASNSVHTEPNYYQ